MHAVYNYSDFVDLFTRNEPSHPAAGAADSVARDRGDAERAEPAVPATSGTLMVDDI